MADEQAHVNRTLEDIKRQIAAKIEEAARMITGANTLEDMLGVQPSTLADFLNDIETHGPSGPSTAQPVNRGAQGSSSPRGSGPRSIKPDQFLGESPLDAAKKYLGLVGHAVHLDEISDAIQRGGAAVKGSDWRDVLETSLVRSVYEVVKVQDKTFGLLSFYTPDQIAGLRGTRRSAHQKAKKKSVGKKKDKTIKTAKSTADAKPPKVAHKLIKPDAKAVAGGDAAENEQIH